VPNILGKHTYLAILGPSTCVVRHIIDSPLTRLDIQVFTTFFGPVVVDFYFTKEGNWVRFDQRSPGQKTTVVTQIYNFAEPAEFADTVFSGYKLC
jgi:hypothetical protein